MGRVEKKVFEENAMNDNELEQFKQDVSLSAYAESAGWVLDRKKSSTQMKVYRREQDKILIWRGRDGHDVYRNERNQAECGSVIDFVMKQENCSLGRARVTLRSYLGISKQEPSLPPCPSFKARVPASTASGDGYRKKTAAVWLAATKESAPGYLLTRGLTLATLTTDRFVDTFRTDTHGNVVFLHYDRGGACGYDRRGPDFKAFGKDVKKALWYSRNIREAKEIALCESPIDCFSHFQLHGGDSAYVSISGTPSALQRDLLTGLLAKAADRGVKVYSAFDNDAAGDEYAELMQLLSPQPLVRLRPIANDWSDDVKNAGLYSVWKVRFSDGRSMTLREPEPTCFEVVWAYACSLTGVVGIAPMGSPA